LSPIRRKDTGPSQTSARLTVCGRAAGSHLGQVPAGLAYEILGRRGNVASVSPIAALYGRAAESWGGQRSKTQTTNGDDVNARTITYLAMLSIALVMLALGGWAAKGVKALVN
jgi:hypothetical protein